MNRNTGKWWEREHVWKQTEGKTEAKYRTFSCQRAVIQKKKHAKHPGGALLNGAIKLVCTAVEGSAERSWGQSNARA